MGIGWLVFLGLIAILAVVLTRHYRTTTTTRPAAHDVLDERFARGDIDETEYRHRREVLGG
jgi:putative membrane protein